MTNKLEPKAASYFMNTENNGYDDDTHKSHYFFFLFKILKCINNLMIETSRR